MRRPIILLVLSLLALSGCGLFSKPQPLATRRYQARTFADANGRRPDATGDLADITVFSLPVPGSAPNGVLSLAPQAQAEFVRAVAATPAVKTPGAIAAGVAMPLTAETSPPGTQNLAQISRRVVFSIENRALNPADRLQSARIRVRLNPDQAYFVSWDKIATEHTSVDAGTLSFTQGRKVEAGLGATLPVFSAAPSVSGSATSEMEERVSLNQRLVKLNGALTEHEAVLLQQSASGLDLTGNVFADFTMQARRHPEWFYSFTHEGSGCDQPRVRGEWNWIASRITPITAEITLEYVLRRVESGDATITESDDSVTFLFLTRSTTAEIIPTSALRVYSWLVRTDDTPDGVLQLRSRAGGMDLDRSTPVQFASYEDAERMLTWLRRCDGKIPGFDVTVRGQSPATQRLYIDRVNANGDSVVGSSPRREEAERLTTAGSR